MLNVLASLPKNTAFCIAATVSAATVGASPSTKAMASPEGASGEGWKDAKSIYEFSANDIDGNDVPMEKYRGHVCLIVNALHTKYAESQGLRILAFPCNQFGSQEPGSEDEIKKFATEKYGVQFDMFSKVNVNGKEAHPLYKYLKLKQKGMLGDFIKWNFTKFLVDKNGQPVKRYSPNTEPFTVEKDFDAYFKA
ncbi:glutathione peroxidase gpx1 [Nucella lapillus]